MNRSLGLVVLNFSTALYLLATGIMGFSKRGEFNTAANQIFNGNLVNIFAIVFSICAVAAGVFILLRLFGTQIAITEILLVILMIVWVVFIILIDIFPLVNGKFNFVDFLRDIGTHLMVLGGMSLATARFSR
jgi:hypothetical protein